MGQQNNQFVPPPILLVAQSAAVRTIGGEEASRDTFDRATKGAVEFMHGKGTAQGLNDPLATYPVLAELNSKYPMIVPTIGTNQADLDRRVNGPELQEAYKKMDQLQDKTRKFIKDNNITTPEAVIQHADKLKELNSELGSFYKDQLHSKGLLQTLPDNRMEKDNRLMNTVLASSGQPFQLSTVKNAPPQPQAELKSPVLKSNKMREMLKQAVSIAKSAIRTIDPRRRGSADITKHEKSPKAKSGGYERF